MMRRSTIFAPRPMQRILYFSLAIAFVAGCGPAVMTPKSVPGPGRHDPTCRSRRPRAFPTA